MVMSSTKSRSARLSGSEQQQQKRRLLFKSTTTPTQRGGNSGSHNNNNTNRNRFISSVSFICILGLAFHTYFYTNTKTRMSNRRRQRLASVRKQHEQLTSNYPGKIQNEQLLELSKAMKAKAASLSSNTYIDSYDTERNTMNEPEPVALSDGDAIVEMTIQRHWDDNSNRNLDNDGRSSSSSSQRQNRNDDKYMDDDDDVEETTSTLDQLLFSFTSNKNDEQNSNDDDGTYNNVEKDDDGENVYKVVEAKDKESYDDDYDEEIKVKNDEEYEEYEEYVEEEEYEEEYDNEVDITKDKDTDDDTDDDNDPKTDDDGKNDAAEEEGEGEKYNQNDNDGDDDNFAQEDEDEEEEANEEQDDNEEEVADNSDVENDNKKVTPSESGSSKMIPKKQDNKKESDDENSTAGNDDNENTKKTKKEQITTTSKLRKEKENDNVKNTNKENDSDKKKTKRIDSSSSSSSSSTKKKRKAVSTTSTKKTKKRTSTSTTSTSGSTAVAIRNKPTTYLIPHIDELIKPTTDDDDDDDDKKKNKNKKTSPFDTASKSIIGNVSNLLDFAILGHAKCATSFLMEWFNRHSEIQIWDYEVCYLYDHQPTKLIQKIYTDFIVPSSSSTTKAATSSSKDTDDNTSSDKSLSLFPIKKSTKIGFKCPGHFSRPSLRYFHDYFTNTVLIIGLRHPVRWFESYYNFRFRHMRSTNNNSSTVVVPLPKPEQLIIQGTSDDCPNEAQGVCTTYAKFHQNLAKFGKTNWKTNQEERDLLQLESRIQSMRTIHNPIFLYDTAQFYDSNTKRKDELKYTIQQFVGLTKDLGTFHDPYKSSRNVTKYKAMNICDDQYINVRTELLSIGKVAAKWISKYFITLPDVTVSNPQYFTRILNTYQYDPCTTNITEMLL